MENKKLYNLLGDIALEFRVSLKNICKLFGKESTEENMMQIFNNIIQAKDNVRDITNEFKYLFFCETYNEPQTTSRVSYTKAVNYIKRYNKIIKEGTSEEKKEILKELYKTENDLKSIKHKLGNDTLNEEEISIVCRFRIKHVMSRHGFSEFYNVTESSLRRAEPKITSNILKQKLETLKDYYLTVTSPAKKRIK